MLTRRVRFGPFEADVTSGELWRDGAAVPVQDLPFRVLTTLIERPGTLVTRAELAARLWGSDTFVDAAAGLNTAVAKLREALGDSADAPSYIETIPKRGYRFIGAIVSEGERTATTSTSAEATVDGSAERTAQSLSPALLARRPLVTWTVAGVVVLMAVLFAAFQLRADRGRVRVAVVLFDNETGRPELSDPRLKARDSGSTEVD